jgi:hypothetical protein
MLVVNYRGVEKTALASFLVTVCHFLLYVPTMLVIGLRGAFLHPIAILVCDMVVYAEFIVHPTVLLCTSTRMRQEIRQTVKRLLMPPQTPTCTLGTVSASAACERRTKDSEDATARHLPYLEQGWEDSSIFL